MQQILYPKVAFKEHRQQTCQQMKKKKNIFSWREELISFSKERIYNFGWICIQFFLLIYFVNVFVFAFDPIVLIWIMASQFWHPPLFTEDFKNTFVCDVINFLIIFVFCWLCKYICIWLTLWIYLYVIDFVNIFVFDPIVYHGLSILASSSIHRRHQSTLSAAEAARRNFTFHRFSKIFFSISDFIKIGIIV